MRTRVPVLLVVAVLVAGSILIGRWWSHPALFGDHGDGFSVAPRPLADSALSLAVTFPAPDGGSQEVTFRDARADFTHNSAAARASFSICHPRPEAGLIGYVKGNLRPFCSAVRPLVPGARMTYSTSERGDYVVMTLRPTRRGAVHVAGIDLDYALGWRRLFQRGTDRVAVDVTARVR